MNSTLDLTKGRPAPLILRFFFPLLLTNIIIKEDREMRSSFIWFFHAKVTNRISGCKQPLILLVTH